MKQVVQRKKYKPLFTEEVDGYKYYGFNIAGNSPGYIAAEDLVDSPRSFAPRFFEAMTTGNVYGNTFRTLQECIEYLLDDRSDCEVFEFDSYQELLKWGSEQ